MIRNDNPEPPRIVTFQDVSSARKRLRRHLDDTPCVPSKMKDSLGMDLWLKLDGFQYTGSFKERGMLNALLNLNEEDKSNGVVSASMGNSALALAYWGTRLGIPVVNVVPEIAVTNKVYRCGKFGGKVVMSGSNVNESREAAVKIAEERGLLYVNADDHPDVIAGVGTVVFEILEQIGEVDVVVVPAGAGTMLAGVLVVLKELSPRTKVIGVELRNVPILSTALKSGKPVKVTIADAPNVIEVGRNVFATIDGNADEVVTVSEEMICAAIFFLAEEENIICEGAGAAPFASVLDGHLDGFRGKRIVLVTGASNIDTTVIMTVMDKAQAFLGRIVKIFLFMRDRPGAAEILTHRINRLGIRIQHINLDRVWICTDRYVFKVILIVEMATVEHAIGLKKMLTRFYSDVSFPEFPDVYKAKCLGELAKSDYSARAGSGAGVSRG